MSVVRQVQLPFHRPACASKEGGREEKRASTVEAAVSVNCRRDEREDERGKSVFIGAHFENKRERDAGKSLAGQRRKSRKGWPLRRGLDEAQTASVTPRGAPHCPGPSQCGMGPIDSGEPAVSRPCLWANLGNCYVSAPAAHQAKRIVTCRSYRMAMSLSSQILVELPPHLGLRLD